MACVPFEIEEPRHDEKQAVGCRRDDSWVATIYPARRAARTQPAEALRYE